MDLSNYIDVPTRFAALLEKWPELRIKEHRPEIVTIGDKTFISVTMQAWRTPDDPQPCQATCFEPFPGKTSFTRDSEQMNASTSCLGRLAGLMMSFPKMASLEEVVNRQTERSLRSVGSVRRSDDSQELSVMPATHPPATKRLSFGRIEL
jgi:hypothetical protein